MSNFDQTYKKYNYLPRIVYYSNLNVIEVCLINVTLYYTVKYSIEKCCLHLFFV